ncbi:hypothetical protein [Streptomyces erythrochromogenes]|jgi:hypothetical protein|uniref:hypothetical protein n=1 Tax=Streptomyces erythrochromogenes TaxID=285574 RepID=UPI002255EC67|nr:hypothetical protein [Streptomyces erythrochromogenes]MCX5587584.1 hypothetical protein [Streptomyces erythrochromogenes]
MTDYPPHALPALDFITNGPDGNPIRLRVDEDAPLSLRDRELLRALMTTAYRHLQRTEDAAQVADGSSR